MKQIHIWAAVVCLLLASCSDIRFGDDFLGDHPESSGATLDEMFSSAVNADRVLTKAYTYLPYGLPTGDRPYDKLGVNILEAITDLHYSFRNNMSDGPVNLYYNGALSSNIGTSDLQGREAYRFGSEPEYNAIRYAWISLENADLLGPQGPRGRGEDDHCACLCRNVALYGRRAIVKTFGCGQ